ncbi:MAG: hypothetical protein ACR2GN_05425 [Bacteroidia bacterium]
MKLLLEIKDEKAGFILELLKNFSFVKAKQLTPYKAGVIEGIREAAEEMKLIKEGKLKGIPAKDLYNEL